MASTSDTATKYTNILWQYQSEIVNDLQLLLTLWDYDALALNSVTFGQIDIRYCYIIK